MRTVVKLQPAVMFRTFSLCQTGTLFLFRSHFHFSIPHFLVSSVFCLRLGLFPELHIGRTTRSLSFCVGSFCLLDCFWDLSSFYLCLNFILFMAEQPSIEWWSTLCLPICQWRSGLLLALATVKSAAMNTSIQIFAHIPPEFEAMPRGGWGTRWEV